MNKLWCQLGRAGDICGILPLLHHDFLDTNEKPGLMVAAEYAPLLDGVSYIEPVIHNGPHYELDIAVAKAKTICKEVVVTQFNAPRVAVDEQTRRQAPAGQATSFLKDMWRVAGRLSEWDELYPLVFDKRDKARETALLRNHDLIKRGKKKPLMLLALKSYSSRFPYAALLKELVTLRFGGEYRILEMPQAERLYDLLALYERAAVLIAVDSAPLHLAWACRKLPVIALTQDRPLLWHGSSWRPNHVWYCRYHDWPARAVEMLERIAQGFTQPSDVTVWSEYSERHGGRYQDGLIMRDGLPVTIGACGRDSGNTLKDDKRHPFLKDVIRMAMQVAPGSTSKITLIRPQVKVNRERKPMPPYFAYRITPNADGEWFAPITDLFCATRLQWKDMLPEIPDLVLSKDYMWSECLRVLFQKKGAKDETGICEFVKKGD